MGDRADVVIVGAGAAGTLLATHRLGLAVDACGRLLAPDGTETPGLWALGPLRKGTLFKTTAVPEIRAQALALAPLLTAVHMVPGTT